MLFRILAQHCIIMVVNRAREHINPVVHRNQITSFLGQLE